MAECSENTESVYRLWVGYKEILQAGKTVMGGSRFACALNVCVCVLHARAFVHVGNGFVRFACMMVYVQRQIYPSKTRYVYLIIPNRIYTTYFLTVRCR